MRKSALDAYCDLVQAVGPGFHPDTLGVDYTSLPDGYTAADVDRIIDDAYAARINVHAVALSIVQDFFPNTNP